MHWAPHIFNASPKCAFQLIFSISQSIVTCIQEVFLDDVFSFNKDNIVIALFDKSYVHVLILISFYFIHSSMISNNVDEELDKKRMGDISIS